MLAFPSVYIAVSSALWYRNIALLGFPPYRSPAMERARWVPRGDLMRRTVLIVDDNAFIRQGLCELFKRDSNFDVCGEAENGRQAIDQAARLHPDLIVLDLSMPVMNGMDAARVLKRMMPAIPLIMYSAFGDRLSEQQARLIGIAEIVSKTDRVSVLLEKARALVYRRAA